MARIAGLVLAGLLVATSAWAQEWRGDGRLAGKVVDEQGKALVGVTVTASLPGIPGAAVQGKTDKRGEWTIEGVAEGAWHLVFELDKYVSGQATSDVDETGRAVSVRTTLKKAFDPNAFIQDEIKKADALMQRKDYAGARAVYEAIVAKVPEVTGPMQQYISRTYYAEGKPDKAIEHLTIGLEKDPANLPMKLLLVAVLAQTGKTDEAIQAFATIDETTIPDPEIYLNLGVGLIKQEKPLKAVEYLDKAVTRFPQAPEAYYYRANALIGLVNAEKDPKNPQRIERLAKIKADLNKFLQLAPNAPEAPLVRQLLEQIEK